MFRFVIFLTFLATVRSVEKIGDLFNTRCQCNYRNIWLDVVFLFDASSLTRKYSFDRNWDDVKNVLSQMTVEKTGFTESNLTSRVAIVTYGNEAHVFKSLGNVTNEDIEAISSLPYNEDEHSDLQKGLQAAIQQFNNISYKERPHVRKMVVVLTDVYNPFENNADKIVNRFKVGGGIVMIHNYYYPNTRLQQLASSGYYFTDRNARQYNFLESFCDANCFCPLDYQSFLQSKRSVPLKGCYLGARIENDYRRASHRCSTENKGFLAVANSEKKTAFLSGLFPPDYQFYIGLNFDITRKKWLWVGGSPLEEYHPWINDLVPDGSDEKYCASVTVDQKWEATLCSQGLPFVCEAHPCDSNHYCD